MSWCMILHERAMILSWLKKPKVVVEVSGDDIVVTTPGHELPSRLQGHEKVRTSDRSRSEPRFIAGRHSGALSRNRLWKNISR